MLRAAFLSRVIIQEILFTTDVLFTDISEHRQGEAYCWKHFFLLTNQLCFPFISVKQIKNLTPKRNKELIILHHLLKVCFVQSMRLDLK